MKKFVFLMALAVGFASCSPIVHKSISKPLTPLENTKNVVVYDIGEMPPDYAEVIGSMQVENGFCRCDWDNILETAKKTARKAGGNGIEIIQHYYPGDIDFCHIIVAYILNVDPNNKPIELSESAQQNFHDYVVLREGDTTRCIVTDETQNSLAFIYEGQGITRRARLSKDKILAYHIDDPVALADAIYQRDKKIFSVRFGFDGGYALRTAGISKDVTGDYKDYLRKLTRGPIMGANFRVNIDKMYTIGIHYDRFMSSNAGYFYAYDEYGDYHEGLISDNHVINFIAASAGYQMISSNEKHRFFFDYLVGYMDYTDTGEEFGTTFKINGATLGMGMLLDYDYMVSKHIGIGAGLSYYSAALSKMYINGHEQNLGKNKEGLQRVNFKAGVRFYL